MARERVKSLLAACIPMGVVLLLGGWVVHDTAGGALPGVLVIVGALLCAAGVAANGRAILAMVTGHGTAEKANFALVIALALTLAGLLCYISTRRFARMDWTARAADGLGRHQLNAGTVSLLRELGRRIDVTLVYRETGIAAAERWREAVLNMLAEFRAYNSLITLREVNVTMQGELHKRLANRLGEPHLPELCVVFETDESHIVVTLAETLSALEKNLIFSGEAAFSLALQRLTTPQRPVVYVLTDYTLPAPDSLPPDDERPSLGKALAMFKKDRYEVRRLPLAGAVPADCAAILIAGYGGEFSDHRVEAIEDYLALRDGRIVIAAEPGLPEEVGEALNRLTSPTVVVRTDALVISPSSDSYGRVKAWRLDVPVSFVQAGASHPVASDLTDRSLVFPETCAIEVVDPRSTPGASLQAVPILAMPGPGWGETDRETLLREYTADFSIEEGDVPWPPTVAAIVQKPGAGPLGELGPAEPRMAVFGSSRAFTDGAAGLADNLQLLRNAVNWQVRFTSLPELAPRLLQVDTVTVSQARLRALRYAFLGGLPLCVVLFGLTVWRMRRK